MRLDKRLDYVHRQRSQSKCKLSIVTIKILASSCLQFNDTFFWCLNQPPAGKFLHFDHLTFWVGNAKQVLRDWKMKRRPFLAALRNKQNNLATNVLVGGVLLLHTHGLHTARLPRARNGIAKSCRSRRSARQSKKTTCSLTENFEN